MTCAHSSFDEHSRCGDCDFWNQRITTDGHATDEGDCRRRPPSATANRWPKTKSDEWCGEFRRTFS